MSELPFISKNLILFSFKILQIGKKLLSYSEKIKNLTELKQDFKENKFTIQLGSTPVNHSSIAFEVVNQKNNKFTVVIKEGYTSNDVLQYFIQQNISIESFNEQLPSLNDIFIQLVEGTKATTRSFQKMEE